MNFKSIYVNPSDLTSPTNPRAASIDNGLASITSSLSRLTTSNPINFEALATQFLNPSSNNLSEQYDRLNENQKQVLAHQIYDQLDEDIPDHLESIVNLHQRLIAIASQDISEIPEVEIETPASKCRSRLQSILTDNLKKLGILIFDKLPIFQQNKLSELTDDQLIKTIESTLVTLLKTSKEKKAVSSQYFVAKPQVLLSKAALSNSKCASAAQRRRSLQWNLRKTIKK